MQNLLLLFLHLPASLAAVLAATITAPPLLHRAESSLSPQFIGYTYQSAKCMFVFDIFAAQNILSIQVKVHH